MPTTTTLVSITHPDTGQQIAAGEEITLSDEDYYDMRSDGKIAASPEEVAEHATPDAEGNYSARASRGGSAAPSRKEEGALPGPSAPTKERDDKERDDKERDDKERVRR